MNYTEWLPTVFPEITNDPLWRMQVYRLGLFIGDSAWFDTNKLAKDPRMLKITDQLYSPTPSNLFSKIYRSLNNQRNMHHGNK